MTPLGILRKLLKGLTQNTSPSEIAAGFAVGAVIGLVPKANLSAQLLLILLMLLKTNVPVGLAAAALFTPLSALSDPLAGSAGYALLAAPALQGFWTTLYNMPVLPWTGFNNTLVLGNLLLGAALFAPLFLLARKAARYYQEHLSEKVRNSRLAGLLRKSWIADWYFKVES